MTNFEIALAHVLRAEGGFVFHPADPGHETNFGITRATLERYRGCVVLAEDVKALSKEEARDIYRKFYWDQYALDQITNPKIAVVLFDQIVNRRAVEVIRGLQLAILSAFGEPLKIDGVLGPRTIEAVNRVRPDKLLVSFIIQAQNSYFEIVERSPSQSVFLKGWIARTWRLLNLV